MRTAVSAKSAAAVTGDRHFTDDLTVDRDAEVSVENRTTRKGGHA